MAGEKALAVEAAGDVAKAEELRLWRYDADEKAETWVKGETYIMASETEIAAIEKAMGVTARLATADDRAAKAEPSYFGPYIWWMKCSMPNTLTAEDYQKLFKAFPMPVDAVK